MCLSVCVCVCVYVCMSFRVLLQIGMLLVNLLKNWEVDRQKTCELMVYAVVRN